VTDAASRDGGVQGTAAPPAGRLSARILAPRGLLGRTLLIVLVPLVILQAVALQLFYGSHLDVISRRLAAGLAGDVGMVVELLSRFPAAEDRAWIFREAAWRLDLAFALEPGGQLALQGARPASLPLLPLEGDLADALAERVRLPFDSDWATDPRRIFIRVQLPDGVLHVEANRKRLFTGTLYLFVIWLVGSAVLLFGLAALFLKNQVKAIRRLAGAAEEFGLGRDAGPIKPEGASEVRQAAAAFNRMRGNIRRFVQQRTEMLAGISHDLRTPLTRLRLGLAMLPPAAAEDAAEMTRDVEEMERMIAAYLAFARGEGQEAARPEDVVALVRDVAARSAGNLLDNARRHADRIAVAVRAPTPTGAGFAEITVDDDGPGIAPEARDEAFRPFASSRAGGTGLGLAIARDIARAHGGDILLEDSPLGGLRARVLLPG